VRFQGTMFLFKKTPFQLTNDQLPVIRICDIASAGLSPGFLGQQAGFLGLCANWNCAVAVGPGAYFS
jgi:hypothetical protein